MLLVRDVFRLKYGAAKPAIAAFRESKDLMKKLGMTMPFRVMTDLVGPAYTLVLEMQVPDLAAFEATGKKIMSNDEWRAWYQKFTPHVESGYREIFTIVDEG
jgi:hypothetical protein